MNFVNGFAFSSYDEYVKNQKNGTVVDYTKNGKCSGCGSCCTSNLSMTDEEIRIIKNYVKRHNIKIKKIQFPTVRPVIDMTCPFLDETVKEKKCQIYEVRPQICRMFSCHEPNKIYEMLDDKDVFSYHRVNPYKEFFPLGK